MHIHTLETFLSPVLGLFLFSFNLGARFNLFKHVSFRMYTDYSRSNQYLLSLLNTLKYEGFQISNTNKIRQFILLLVQNNYA